MLPKLIHRLPVVESHGRLYALGVPLWLDPPCRVSDDHCWKIDDALATKAAAEGANRPVALSPSAWLHRCARCWAPFIDVSEARLCSDQCRAQAKRESVRRASAKRSQRRAKEHAERTVTCRQCGKAVGASRSTRHYCTPACRVAWHRARAERAALAEPSPTRS
jgi:hypothetical protein